jgi:hypothetical protein
MIGSGLEPLSLCLLLRLPSSSAHLVSRFRAILTCWDFLGFWNPCISLVHRHLHKSLNFCKNWKMGVRCPDPRKKAWDRSTEPDWDRRDGQPNRLAANRLWGSKLESNIGHFRNGLRDSFASRLLPALAGCLLPALAALVACLLPALAALAVCLLVSPRGSLVDL